MLRSLGREMDQKQLDGCCSMSIVAMELAHVSQADKICQKRLIGCNWNCSVAQKRSLQVVRSNVRYHIDWNKKICSHTKTHLIKKTFENYVNIQVGHFGLEN